MNAARMLARLAASETRLVTLRHTATSIAHGHAELDSDAIAALRTGLAELTLDGREAGYRDALIDVLAAFEIDRDESDAERALAKQHEDRPSGMAMQALALETEGIGPTQLAAAIGRDSGQITRVLTALADQRLVEEVPSAGDARGRPRRLTALGKRVAVHLGQVSAAERKGATSAVEALAHAIAVEDTQPALVDPLAVFALDLACARGVAELNDGAYSIVATDRVERLLYEAAELQQWPAFLRGLDAAVALVVRSDREAAWRFMLENLRDRPFERLHIIRTYDITAGELSRPTAPYVLVYEHPALRSAGRPTPFELESEQTACIVQTRSAKLPKSVVQLQLGE
jgi:DNA-binding MarR family transcriptional regulator